MWIDVNEIIYLFFVILFPLLCDTMWERNEIFQTSFVADKIFSSCFRFFYEISKSLSISYNSKIMTRELLSFAWNIN